MKAASVRSGSRDEILRRLGEQGVQALYSELGVERFAAGGPDNWLVNCPWRIDVHPSLTIRKTDGVWSDNATGEGGSIFDAVMRTRDVDFQSALECVQSVAGFAAFLNDQPTWSSARIITTYDYRDEQGSLLFQAVRFEPKTFRQRRPGGDGRWIWDLKNVRLVLYRLPELMEAEPDEWVFVCEGEKDADRLSHLNLVATTNPMGAGKWRSEYTRALRGRKVVLLPDNDLPGLRHAIEVARAISSDVAEVRILELPRLGPRLEKHGKDLSDWLDTGGTREELQQLVESTQTWHSDPDGEDAQPCSGPEFPIHALPEPIRSLVSEGAAALGTPTDFLGTMVLGIAAGVIGNNQRIELKPGFEQRAILWVAVIGNPGSGKTPALNVVRAPTEALQRQAKRDHELAMEEFERTLAQWEAGEKKSRGPKPEPPRMGHYYVSDATLEAIQSIHVAEPGLTLIRDELVGWVKSHDAYRGGKGGDRQSWLASWAGVPIKIDRKSGQPVYIEEPAISVVGGVQPDMLRDLAEEAGRHDGFLDRLLWSFPEHRPVYWTEDRLDPAIISSVRARFERLRTGRDDRPVRLSIQAKRLFVTWHDQNVEAAKSVSGLAAGVYAKLPIQLARICLILHCLRHSGEPASVEASADTMADAIELVEYFRVQAHRVLPVFGVKSLNRGAGLQDRVVRMLSRAGTGWTNQSQVARWLGGHVLADELGATLSALEQEGRVESREGSVGPKGGRPSRQWRVKTQERENLEDWGVI